MGQTTEIPEQFRPKETDKRRFSNTFMSAMNGLPLADNAEAPEEMAKRQTNELLRHNLGVAAAENGSTTPFLTSNAVAARAEHARVRLQEKKRGDEAVDHAVRSAMDAMRQRLEANAEYWHNKADDGERKLGGLSGIAQALGVSRPKGQTDEEFRRYLNEVTLLKIVRGELDPNSDLAIQAQDRKRDYDAQDALRGWNESERRAEQTGDYSEVNRMLDEAKQDDLANHKYSAQLSESLIGRVEEEFNGRVDVGEAEAKSSEDKKERDNLGDNFFGFETAQALDIAGNFERAAQGTISNTPLALTQEQRTSLAVPGMKS